MKKVLEKGLKTPIDKNIKTRENILQDLNQFIEYVKKIDFCHHKIVQANFFIYTTFREILSSQYECPDYDILYKNSFFEKMWWFQMKN